jgi:hypothetical protein
VCVRVWRAVVEAETLFDGVKPHGLHAQQFFQLRESLLQPPVVIPTRILFRHKTSEALKREKGKRQKAKGERKAGLIHSPSPFVFYPLPLSVESEGFSLSAVSCRLR